MCHGTITHFCGVPRYHFGRLGVWRRVEPNGTLEIKVRSDIILLTYVNVNFPSKNLFSDRVRRCDL